MTYCAPKFIKQWTRYKLNIWACAANDTCPLFCLYLVQHVF